MIRKMLITVRNSLRIVNDLCDKSVLYFKIYLEGVKIEKLSSIRGIPFILNKGTLTIEKNVVINSRYRHNPIGGQKQTTFWTKKDGHILIKQGAKISNSTFVSAKKITISENCYIGGDCKIYDTDFHSINSKNRNHLDSDVKSKAIFIDKNVFIGGGTIILKGVKIGRNSIVGAGSVVTKSIPNNEIWAGNPAKLINLINDV